MKIRITYMENKYIVCYELREKFLDFALLFEQWFLEL